MATLFFSYSHKDEALRNQLEVQLAILKRSGAIETWHDRRITAGDEFDASINQYLEEADIILLLLSPDFLASDYCYGIETRRAMERHSEESARVIPVILRPCDWQNTELKNLLAAPRNGKPITMWPNTDEAFLDVINKIRDAIPAPSTPSTSPAPSHEEPISPATLPADNPSIRSSNLRLPKKFTQRDKDQFLEESYQYLLLYFNNSLLAICERNPGLEQTFKEIDATCFTATIYRNGESVAQCYIRHGGMSAFETDITYSNDANPNSMSEGLSIEIGEHSLGLKTTGMSMMGFGQETPKSPLTQEGASEFLWSLLIAPLRG